MPPQTETPAIETSLPAFASRRTLPKSTLTMPYWRLKPTGSNVWPQLLLNNRPTTWSTLKLYELVLGPRSKNSSIASMPMRRGMQLNVQKVSKRTEAASPISPSLLTDSDTGLMVEPTQEG